MVVDNSTLDLNSLLKSKLAGENMSDILGSNDGSGFVMGALLGRLLFNNGNGLDGSNQNSDRAAIDAAVAAALASSNQANNNAMLLLKDIQDSSQEVINNVNSTSQAELIQGLQSQIAIIQGQASTNNLITDAKGMLTNEIHENSSAINANINSLNTNVLQGFNAVTREITNDGDKTRALIQSIETASLNRQLTVAQNEITELRGDARVSRSARETEVNVTQNVNQNQFQQQQQQQIWNINNLLQDMIAQQKITQGIVNLGTMTGSAGQQTAANTRVNS